MRNDDPCRIHELTLAALDELDELALDPDVVDAARAHLAGCARCQARRRMWTRLDDALRDVLAPTAATSALTTADLLAAIGADHEPRERRTPMLSVIYLRNEDIMDDEHATTATAPSPSRASDAPAAVSDAPAHSFAALPSLKPNQQPPAWRRALAGIVAVAVVIALVGSITGVMALTGHLHGTRTTTASKGAAATQTAQAQPTVQQQPQIGGIAFTSSTDGWVVFYANSQDGGNGTLYHYTNGQLNESFTESGWGSPPMALWPFAPNNVWTFSNGGVKHYNGADWKQQAFPSPPNGSAQDAVTLNALIMVTPTQGWAIGNTDIQSNGAQKVIRVFYHYDGSAWRIDQADSQASAATAGGDSNNQIQITGISATPGGDVWATGYIQSDDANGYPSSTTGYLYHRVGGVWQLAQTLRNDELSGIVMTGPSSGWIIGQSVRVVTVGGNIAPYKVTQITPIALGWNGVRWSPATIPQPDETQAGMTITQIAATNPSNVWIVGISNGTSYTAGSPYASDDTYLAHFDGARWSRVSLPQIAAINPNHDISITNQATFSTISLTPSGDLWMAGQLAVSGQGSYQSTPLLYHYSGGQWANISLPTIKPIAGTPSSGDSGQPMG